MKNIFCLLALLYSLNSFSQGNFNITDPEKEFKEAKDLFIKEQYSLAYPLLKELKQHYPENTITDHTYLNQDVDYYYIVCGLRLNQPVAEAEAKQFITSANNEPRQQIMGYNLAKYYFVKGDYSNAITFYERAGYDNLSNDEIADAKFELAYSYFNVKRFSEAKPLFNEVHQLPKNKYYYPANYYYGYISYSDKDFTGAMKAFKVVENQTAYQGLVPYYISEIYYFQGNKDEALKYGQEALNRGNLYYRKDLNLLIGQIYFEKKDYAKALTLLEEYVNSSDKVSKEVLYELSYCYYEANQVEKAIEGFKQLSSETDSLGQNSMYLLGDLYLRTNQKANARNAFQFSAANSSNRKQQEISRFNYAKLSYELGYQDVALKDMNTFLDLYPTSTYATEAKEILIGMLANTNNFNSALSLYESFDNPTPSMQKVYPQILFGKATELINDQKLQEADVLLNKIIKDQNAGKLLLLANFWKGEIAYRLARHDDAIRYMAAYLQSANIQGEATPMAAKYVTGYSFLKKENFKEAITSFEQVTKTVAATSNPLEQDAYLRAADSYFMLKDYNRARTMYDNVLNTASAQSDYALFQKALIAGINNSNEKVKLLNSLSTQYPSSDLSGDALIEIANTYMAQEKFRDAVPYLDKLLNLKNAQGLHPAAFLKLGLSQYNLNNNAEALNAYQKLVSNYPQSPEADEALENMKSIYVEEGKPNDYVEVLRKAGKNISVSEADSLTYSAAELKYNSGDCANAITGFNNYLSSYPNGSFAVQANYFSGECYAKSKDWTNALKGYEAVVKLGNSKYAEASALAAARLFYLEIKDYEKAKTYFAKLRDIAISPENQLEALRGLVRTYYQTKDYEQASTASKELLTKKGLSTDDRVIANLVLGKSLQTGGNCEEAINAYKQVAAANKAAWGAEARYEIASCYFTQNNLGAAEKAGLEVIKVTGSQDYWVAKAYILLGDVYMKQKDYFNAKATYQSVSDNATIPELKAEAKEKLNKAVAEEKANSKIGG
ncbi:MAG: tetratricopeptide repeat protein [Ginsengibacter sp.]